MSQLGIWWIFWNAYGAALPHDWETFGVCMILAGLVLAGVLGIYHEVNREWDE